MSMLGVYSLSSPGNDSTLHDSSIYELELFCESFYLLFDAFDSKNIIYAHNS